MLYMDTIRYETKARYQAKRSIKNKRYWLVDEALHEE